MSNGLLLVIDQKPDVVTALNEFGPEATTSIISGGVWSNTRRVWLVNITWRFAGTLRSP